MRNRSKPRRARFRVAENFKPRARINRDSVEGVGEQRNREPSRGSCKRISTKNEAGLRGPRPLRSYIALLGRHGLKNMKHRHPLFPFCCLSLLALNITAALACRCSVPSSAKVSLKQSAAVFAGKVISIESNVDSQRVRFNTIKFQVSKSWKGGAAKTIVVTTPGHSEACGFHFDRGQSYLVYAYTIKGQKGLLTGICTRTKPLTQAKQDLAELGAGKS